jgi:hypothetical protein
MFPSNPPQDFRQAEQASRDRYRDLESTAARRSELGIQRRTLRESVRHWYRRLTGRETAER